MSELKIGDMAIIVRGKGYEVGPGAPIGSIVEIIDPLGSEIVGSYANKEPAYGCKDSDGVEYWIGQSWLRKLPPKQGTTTWEDIQQITGWVPNKQRVES